MVITTTTISHLTWIEFIDIKYFTKKYMSYGYFRHQRTNHASPCSLTIKINHHLAVTLYTSFPGPLFITFIHVLYFLWWNFTWPCTFQTDVVNLSDKSDLTGEQQNPGWQRGYLQRVELSLPFLYNSPGVPHLEGTLPHTTEQHKRTKSMQNVIIHVYGVYIVM